MRLQEGTFVGAKGCSIFWRHWLPDGYAKATVILVHGGSEHSGRYEHVAERLTQEGLAVHTLDHRGHGRSDGPRVYFERYEHVIEDLDHVVEEAPGPRLMFGHSMGGLIALSYALRHQDKLQALALSAPLAVLETAPLLLRAVARTLSRIAPRLGVYEVEAAAVSRDPDEVRKYDEDPLNYRGKIPARTVTELADEVGSFPERLPVITLPLLTMQGTADRIVPPSAGPFVHETVSSTDNTLTMYEGYYHELVNEPAEDRAPVIDQLATWLTSRL